MTELCNQFKHIDGAYTPALPSEKLEFEPNSTECAQRVRKAFRNILGQLRVLSAC